jgi:hypothetical protein
MVGLLKIFDFNYLGLTLGAREVHKFYCFVKD